MTTTSTSPLSVELANTALALADHPVTAVSALMTAAAAILQRAEGPEGAAQMMLDMVIEARLGLIGGGLVAEPTRQ